jgi:hypothetical protein
MQIKLRRTLFGRWHVSATDKPNGEFRWIGTFCDRAYAEHFIRWRFGIELAGQVGMDLATFTIGSAYHEG